ncbi:MAG: hypothetical protein EOS52_32935 [Mesorhizobium sp.]|nr:MAG: hypothetical protein EOS52_32935 [Mesorhizobium sp.]TIX14586.1 MAG: hypothetical protein E5V41_18255 [Mesorhizobium sp.]
MPSRMTYAEIQAALARGEAVSARAMKVALMPQADIHGGSERNAKAESAAVYRRDLWKAALRQPAMQSEGAAPNESGHRRDLWKAALKRPVEK